MTQLRGLGLARCGLGLALCGLGLALCMAGLTACAGSARVPSSSSANTSAVVDAAAEASGPVIDAAAEAPAPAIAAASAETPAPAIDSASAAPSGGGLVELALPPKREPTVVSLPPDAGVQPVLVAAHGAGGRATTHCKLWRAIVGRRGFVVCPRGHRTHPHERSESVGYFYDGHPALGREIDQALVALQQRFGDRVDLRAPIFAGYSQGASMGSMVLPSHSARFARAVLMEGGFGQHQEWNIAASRRFHDHGGRRVMLACGRFKCLQLARKTAGYMRQGGLQTRVIYAEGAGHTYGGELHRRVKVAFRWLIEGDERWL